MRIGLFTDTFPPDLNGVANSTNILFRELRKHGHEAFVVCTRKGAGWAEWNEDHTILRLAGISFKGLYGYAITTPLHVNALNEIRKLNLDIIHAQTEFGVGIFAHICSKQLNIPLVSTYHTSYEDYTHYINLLNSQRIDNQLQKAVAWLSRIYGEASVSVISPSAKTKEVLEKYKIRTSIHVVPTGLVLDQFHPDLQKPGRTEEIRKEFHVPMEERRVIYLGRIAEEKALDLVIDGFVLAKKNGCHIRLLVVGSGPDLERLKKYVASAQAEDTVMFAGPKPADQVADYYRSADFFASASLSETQGMTFAEAMARGLPLLARKEVVLENLLIDGVTGWYFRDAEDLAEKLKRVSEMPAEELCTMKEAALKQIQPLSSEVFYERVMKVYEDAVRSFSEMMIIEDVQVKDDIVQIYLADMQGRTREDVRILLTMDDYFNEGLRKGMRISESMIESLKEREAAVKAWHSCLRKVAVKDRTRKEIYDWLTKNTSLNIEVINGIVEKLEAKGYINDDRYCEENISKMKLALLGEERIIRSLKKKGIPYEMIRNHLDEKPDDEFNNAMAFASRASSSIRNKSVQMKKHALKEKMLVKGYSQEIADRVISSMNFEEDEFQELDSLRRCAFKAKKHYEKKYDGTRLRNTVFRYCSAQGYQTENIYVILDEMEWD